MAGSPFLRSIGEFMQVRRYSRRTVHTYLYWIRYFIRFHKLQHPEGLSPADVERFLTHLAVDRHVSAATQSLALNALVFLYDKFLGRPLGDIGAFRRSTRQAKLPVVLTVAEVQQLGHADVKTTEIYTHVLNQGAHGVRSPLSSLLRLAE